MNLDAMIERLQLMPGTLAALASGLSDEDLRWRPGESDWSIIEVLCHMADEEVEDFRTRLRLTLEQKGEAWPAINPPQAAIERDYRSQPLSNVLARFTSERTASIKWLRQLTNPDWTFEHHHPLIGVLRSGDLLASWVTHDALHLKQIAKRLFQMARRDTPGFDTAYAGEWQA